MNVILNFVKDYFIFMLILFLFSYLTPREEYRKYVQFLIGALMVAILMRPVLAFFAEDRETAARARLDALLEGLYSVEYDGEGEDIFEWFLEREGVDTEAVE